MTEHRIFSFGGGVQSHAVLALAAAGKVNYEAFVFANVGADSENPDTLAYIENVTKPYCAAHGLMFVEVAKPGRTLLEQVTTTGRRSVDIPAYVEGGGQTPRSCTTHFKIAVVDRWIRAQGWPAAVIGLGISTDEWQRARDTHWHDAHTTQAGNRQPFGFWKQREYPLLTMNLDRARAQRVITEAGLPTPPRSSCYYCPFKRPDEWIALKANNPALFERAAAIEDNLNTKGLAATYRLHASRRPLREAVGDQAMLWPAGDSCDSGYCWT
jgi:hypothetical protein